MEKEHYCIEAYRVFCHITDKHVLISKEPNLINVKTSDSFFVLHGMKIYRLCLIPLFVYLAYQDYLEQNTIGLCLMIFVTVYAIVSTISSMMYSSKQKIDREAVSHVTYKEGIPGFRLSGFMIHFRDKGKMKIRLIPIPSKLSDGDKKTEIALRTFKEAGLYDQASEDPQIIDSF